MADQYAPIPEIGLGYEVFAPLWGVLELGAVTESGAKAIHPTPTPCCPAPHAAHGRRPPVGHSPACSGEHRDSERTRSGNGPGTHRHRRTYGWFVAGCR